MNCSQNSACPHNFISCLSGNSTAPSQPTNVHSLCTVVVWQPPAQPNGNIIRYDIQFSMGTVKEVDSGDRFYITTDDEQEAGTYVRVSHHSDSA